MVKREWMRNGRRYPKHGPGRVEFNGLLPEPQEGQSLAEFLAEHPTAEEQRPFAGCDCCHAPRAKCETFWRDGGGGLFVCGLCLPSLVEQAVTVQQEKARGGRWKGHVREYTCAADIPSWRHGVEQPAYQPPAWVVWLDANIEPAPGEAVALPLLRKAAEAAGAPLPSQISRAATEWGIALPPAKSIRLPNGGGTMRGFRDWRYVAPIF